MSLSIGWIIVAAGWSFHLLAALLTRIGKAFLVCPSCNRPVRRGQNVCHHCFHRIKFKNHIARASAKT